MKTKVYLIIFAASISHSVMADNGIATFYTRGSMADGSAYGHHGNLFCARNSKIKLGTCWLVSANGRSKIITCRDHGPLASRHFDMSRAAFGFFSRGHYDKGVLHIKFREVKRKHAKH